MVGLNGMNEQGQARFEEREVRIMLIALISLVFIDIFWWIRR